jgi:hypothetical protein
MMGELLLADRDIVYTVDSNLAKLVKGQNFKGRSRIFPNERRFGRIVPREPNSFGLAAGMGSLDEAFALEAHLY